MNKLLKNTGFLALTLALMVGSAFGAGGTKEEAKDLGRKFARLALVSVYDHERGKGNGIGLFSQSRDVDVPEKLKAVKAEFESFKKDSKLKSAVVDHEAEFRAGYTEIADKYGKADDKKARRGWKSTDEEKKDVDFGKIFFSEEKKEGLNLSNKEKIGPALRISANAALEEFIKSLKPTASSSSSGGGASGSGTPASKPAAADKATEGLKKYGPLGICGLGAVGSLVAALGSGKLFLKGDEESEKEKAKLFRMAGLAGVLVFTVAGVTLFVRGRK